MQGSRGVRAINKTRRGIRVINSTVVEYRGVRGCRAEEGFVGIYQTCPNHK